jgi:hypothetical protein
MGISPRVTGWGRNVLRKRSWDHRGKFFHREDEDRELKPDGEFPVAILRQ